MLYFGYMQNEYQNIGVPAPIVLLHHTGIYFHDILKMQTLIELLYCNS